MIFKVRRLSEINWGVIIDGKEKRFEAGAEMEELRRGTEKGVD